MFARMPAGTPRRPPRGPLPRRALTDLRAARWPSKRTTRALLDTEATARRPGCPRPTSRSSSIRPGPATTGQTADRPARPLTRAAPHRLRRAGLARP
ncbi:hypothetical protein HBB16_14785 [Pseudonocardia sp. MCCB 268]|nr:hypothetical protein [Pseudonocardia cytotoxica]